MIENKEDHNEINYDNINEEDISGFYNENENTELQNSKKQILIDENKILLEDEYSRENEEYEEEEEGEGEEFEQEQITENEEVN